MPGALSAIGKNIASLVKQVGRHPAVFGYFIRDEPNLAMLPGVAQARTNLGVPRVAIIVGPVGSLTNEYRRIGQEVAVTPVQLVTMVSSIANGGVYLPPHVLFPGQLDSTGASQKPAAPQALRMAT